MILPLFEMHCSKQKLFSLNKVLINNVLVKLPLSGPGGSQGGKNGTSIKDHHEQKLYFPFVLELVFRLVTNFW